MIELPSYRVNASCVVDLVQEVPEKKWRVTVTGQMPYDYDKVYTLAADSDNAAAQEGLRLFVLDAQKI